LVIVLVMVLVLVLVLVMMMMVSVMVVGEVEGRGEAGMELSFVLEELSLGQRWGRLNEKTAAASWAQVLEEKSITL
jgi:hypothetical protein